MKSNKVKNMSDEVTKSNKLNSAIQNLSLVEVRIVQLAIVDARETQTGLTADKPLRITAKRYSDAFDVDIDTAYDVMIAAEATLFERRFSFISKRDNPVKSRWVSQVEYLKGEGAIEIIFTPAVVKEITRIDAIKGKQWFTVYMLSQTAVLNSLYSVRLYELLIQWRKAKKAAFELEVFRGQLGLEVDDYKRLCDFKRRVLDHAVKEINEKTDLQVSYEPEKNGRKVVGYKFLILDKPKAKPTIKDAKKIASGDNPDLSTINGLSDAQLSRITRSPKFIRDFSDLISPTSSINKDMNAWSVEFVGRIKKDHTQFNVKRPIKKYLEY
jgi:plasmid replication initiation protein